MKILTHITLRNIKLNKGRTIMTILGIILSTALITIIMNAICCFQKTSLYYAEIESGKYILSSNLVTTEQLKKIKAHRSVSDVYIKKYVGVTKLPAAKYKRHTELKIEAMDKNTFTNAFHMELTNGRFPQNDKELVLAQNVNRFSQKEYKVGDQLSAKLGETDREYKIVGILSANDSWEVETDDIANAYTFYDGSEIAEEDAVQSSYYVDYKEEDLNEYQKITAELLGITEKQVYSYLVRPYIIGSVNSESIEKILKPGQNVNLNYELLRLQGIGDETMTQLMIYSIGLFFILIVMLVSAVVIRNSFSMSFTEKIKLYGMLSSVGATSKQMRSSILQEGVFYGLIGIPMGIGLGYISTGGLISLVNIILKDSLQGMKLQFGTSVWAMLFAVVLSSLTIFFSSIGIAIKASKTTPIEAIRSQREVKIEKQKPYRSSKMISKIWGIGGDLAYRNLLRSKRKYRTTVFSIMVSVILFIALASLNEYALKVATIEYKDMKYDLYCDYYPGADEEEMTIHKYGEVAEVYEQIVTSKKIKDGYIEYESSGLVKLEKGWLDPVNEREPELDDQAVNIVGVNSRVFHSMVESCHLKYEEVRDKGIYLQGSRKDGDLVFTIPDGTKLDFFYYMWSNEQLKKFNDISVNIATTVKSFPQNVSYMYEQKNVVFVEESFLEKNNANVAGAKMYYHSDQSDAAEELIYDIDDTIAIENVSQYMRRIRSISFGISVCIYSFIAVLLLIGITNIINTIKNNIELRKPEFAMLQSVGMTKKELRKMIRLESWYYGIEALALGIPGGMVGHYGIYYFLNLAAETTNSNINYEFPFLLVGGCIIGVLLLVRLIMIGCTHKIKKQNIIETIRNDNI